MFTTLTHTYLQRMSIDCWRLKQPLSGAATGSDFIAYDLINPANESVGIVCLESRLAVATELAATQLLTAMLAAVQLRYRPLGTEFNNQVVLVMGEKLAQQALAMVEPLDDLRAGNVWLPQQQTSIVVTYHPQDLVRQPADKAKAWADLKKILALLTVEKSLC